MTGVDTGSAVLEVGCGTGQATGALARLGCSVIAVEPGPGMSALARANLAGFSHVEVETSTFEEWEDRGRRFDLLVAASSWHWIDPSIGWARAHALLRRRGYVALLANVVVRRPGEPEVYEATADLHDPLLPRQPEQGAPSARGEGSSHQGRLGETRAHREPGPALCPARRSLLPEPPVVRRERLRESASFHVRVPESRPRSARSVARRNCGAHPHGHGRLGAPALLERPSGRSAHQLRRYSLARPFRSGSSGAEPPAVDSRSR